MKSLSAKLSVLVIMAVIAGVSAASNPDETTLSRIKDYRHWTRLNPEPVTVTSDMKMAVTIVGTDIPIGTRAAD